jgi:L-seryl-tRNA(Ser) seleniumtransferase
MSALRELPSVDRVIQAVQQALGAAAPDHALIRDLARNELAVARESLRTAATAGPPDLAALVAAVCARLAALDQPSLRPVINASGVIIQTNLGRAPLSAGALAAMQRVGAGYSNLEYDLADGARGSRYVHLAQLLCDLTGAAAAMAVNNNAAAIYLALIALAAGREVIVSRGQAVEIGGGFRIPDVLRQSGATLVEVGTTNRTYAGDYAAAINERTALLMRVHSSNFRLEGFVHETSLTELADVGRTHAVPVLDDLGSGTLLDTTPYGLAPEPTVMASITAGADLVAFSGDKLLGGPQAGLLVGRADLIAQLKRHPLARALRIDKTTIAGLEATLRSYRRGRAVSEIPVWRMISSAAADLHTRATVLAATLAADGLPAAPIACRSAVGGGSLPGATQPSWGVALACAGVDELARYLRMHDPPVVARIVEDRLLCDLRTVLPEEEAALAAALRSAWRMRTSPEGAP